MAPGARRKFGACMFEFEVVGIEKSTCDRLGTFRRPRSDSAPGDLFTPFRYAPDQNPYQTLVLSSGVWWSLLPDIRCQ